MPVKHFCYDPNVKQLDYIYNNTYDRRAINLYYWDVLYNNLFKPMLISINSKS